MQVSGNLRFARRGFHEFLIAFLRKCKLLYLWIACSICQKFGIILVLNWMFFLMKYKLKFLLHSVPFLRSCQI